METGKKMVESMKETAANVVGGGGGGGGGDEPHYSHSTTGATGHSTGAHQMSALPGHGTGEPAGGSVVEGTVKTRPIAKGTGSGTGRATTAQNTHVGGGSNTGLTGTGYNG